MVHITPPMLKKLGDVGAHATWCIGDVCVRPGCAVWTLLGLGDVSRHWWTPSCMFLAQPAGVHLLPGLCCCLQPLQVSGFMWVLITTGFYGVCSVVIQVTLMVVGVSLQHRHCLVLFLLVSLSLCKCLVEIHFSAFEGTWIMGDIICLYKCTQKKTVVSICSRWCIRLATCFCS